MSIQSRNPYNEELLKEYEEFSGSRIEQALKTGDQTYNIWRKTTFSERASLMSDLADRLENQVEALARVITQEMGKLRGESESEVKKCAWVCRYYAEHAETFLREESLPVEESESYIAYDPLGIVLAIMPWNFPFWQVFRFAAPTIMAGNVGILKHASNVSQCAIEIERLFREAGFPEGVFQSLIIGSGKVGPIIDDERVKAVTLTGSDPAGRSVAERAGRNLKKLVLELGGSDPFIVLRDADLGRAIQTAVKARMINCGQSCIAAKRFIVEKEIAGDFIDGFKRIVSGLQLGDPWDDATDVAPMARRDLREDLEGQVRASVKKGARLEIGGDIPGRPGMFYSPAVLTGVKPGMPAFDEELFGPVASVIVVKDEMEAISTANLSKFGLGASLWSNDIDRAAKLVREIESGAVFVNAMVASHPKVPFGGIKSSGYGRELSHVGIREFMNVKSVWIE